MRKCESRRLCWGPSQTGEKENVPVRTEPLWVTKQQSDKRHVGLRKSPRSQTHREKRPVNTAPTTPASLEVPLAPKREKEEINQRC